MIEPAPHVAAMMSYALAELTPAQGKRLISLSQNESYQPPSPQAVAAAVDAMMAAHLYPDPEWRALREALAKQHDIQAESILCGNGSMELIASLTQAYTSPEKAVLAPAHAYPFFRTAAQLAQARFDIAAEEGRQVSVDALLAAVRPDTALVFVANPGNPTGTRISRAELLRLREGLRSDVLLVIDEAYGEFADHLGEPMFDLVERGDTVVLRTFSKAYGLAGMRVGWGVFPAHVAMQVQKVMNPNNTSVAGQAAACAAVKDQTYMRALCESTAKARDQFIDRLRAVGFAVADSFTNFVLIPFDSPEVAKHVDTLLRAEGIFLRGQGGAGLPDCLRVTIGRREDMRTAAILLERWAEEHRL